MEQALEPYTLVNFLVQQSGNSINWELVLAITAVAISLIALIFSIWQTKMTQRGLLLTRISINKADTNKQIELLPKHRWVILVDVRFNIWMEDIAHNIAILKDFIEGGDTNTLSFLKTNIRQPQDLYLRKYESEGMPPWLLELYLSGAQYYFAGMGSIAIAVEYTVLTTIERAQSYLEDCEDHLQSIRQLKELLDGMIPKVILNTPASISSSKFFVD